MKGNSKGRNMQMFMQNILLIYGEEIDRLLRTTDPEYEKREFIKPIWWMDDLEDYPEKYPKLSLCDTPARKRYISYFLKHQGRLPASNTKNARGWVLPQEGVQV